MKVNNKYTKILEIKVGSHLYGTNTPSSDIDYSGKVIDLIKQFLNPAPKTPAVRGGRREK